MIYLILTVIVLACLFHPSTSKSQEYELVLSWPKEVFLNLDSPKGIAVDSPGDIYVTGIGKYCIQKFDSDGNFLTKWGTEGSNDGQFSLPAF